MRLVLGMKIAIVSPFARPELGANVLRVNSLESFLLEKGNEVSIFSPKREKIPEVKGVIRYSSEFDIFSKIFFSDFDVVFYTSPPLTHGFFSGFAARLSGKKFFLDLRDPWPNVYSKLGIYKKSLKLFFYEIIEKLTYFLSLKIFVVTDGIGEHVSKKGFGKKVVLALNGTTPSLFSFDSKKRNILLDKYSLKNKKVFIYSGAFSGWEVDSLIKIFKKFPEDYFLFLLIPRIKFHSSEFDKLVSLTKEKIRNKVEVIDISTMPFENLKDYFSVSDIGISTVPSFMNYCIVVKTYDYCASGLYCLAKGPSQGSLRNLFLNNPIGSYFSDWKSFSKFRVLPTDISQEARKKRIRIAKEKFDRNLTNKIIYSHLSND